MAETLKGLVMGRSAAGQHRWISLLVLAIVVVLGLVGYGTRGVRYHLWLNGEKVAEGRGPGDLLTALDGWASARMTQPVLVEHGGQGWRYSLGELGLVLPLGQATRELERAVASRPWWQWTVEIHLDLPESWDPALLDGALAPIRKAVERPPTPARLVVEGQEVEVIRSIDGLSVDADAVRRALSALGRQDRLLLPVTALRPDQTTEVVEGWGIRRLVAEWSTHYDPSIPRAENVERAAHAFDGMRIKPGEILSYNATVGPVDAANGWKEASVIVAGELVPGIGGGVCQVATTLYGAALRANLEILERHPHQLAVSYIPPSEDAAVAQGYQDLKIRNTTPGHLLLQTEAGDGTVTFRLYGDLPPGQEVRIASEVTGTVPFPTRIVADSTLAPGHQVATEGVPGLTSVAYRLVFLDGELVKREGLSQDRYLPTAAVIRVGPPQPGN